MANAFIVRGWWSGCRNEPIKPKGNKTKFRSSKDRSFNLLTSFLARGVLVSHGSPTCHTPRFILSYGQMLYHRPCKRFGHCFVGKEHTSLVQIGREILICFAAEARYPTTCFAFDHRSMLSVSRGGGRKHYRRNVVQGTALFPRRRTDAVSRTRTYRKDAVDKLFAPGFVDKGILQSHRRTEHERLSKERMEAILMISREAIGNQLSRGTNVIHVAYLSCIGLVLSD